MGQSKAITEGALLIAIYTIILLFALYIPFFILVGTFILPIPFIIYIVRHDWQVTLLFFLAAVFISSILATIVSLPLTILAGISSFFIGLSIRKELSPYEVWARGVIGYIIGLFLNLAFIQFILDINLYEEIELMVNDSVEFAKNFFHQFGVTGFDEEQLQLLEEQMYIFVDLLPSSIVIMSIIFAFITLWLSYRIISRIDHKRLTFPPFKKFDLPIAVVWIYLIVLVFSFFDLTDYDTLNLVIVNAMAVLTVLLIIQGFSFIFFYADHINLHQSIPIVIVIISFISPFIFLFFVRLIGIIDIGFALKKKIANENK